MNHRSFAAASALSRQAGFTIIEALIAMLIMTFGLMAVSGMQITLARGSDISRQQSEATRLAQQKMEDLRSYTQISTATGVISWNGLTSGSDTTTTNATYTRVWTLGGSSSDQFRAATVNVSWLDRSNTSQGITLTSVIAQINPQDIAQLGFPLPQNTNLKPVKNRSLDIPIPAVSLTNVSGQSAYYISNLGASIVFSNTDGSVVRYCSNYQVTSTVTTSLLNSNCTTIQGVILTGYVYDPLAGNGTTYSNSYTSSTTTYVTTYTYNLPQLYTCTKNNATTLYTSSSSGCPSGYQTSSAAYYTASTVLYVCTNSSATPTTYYVATSGTCPTVGSGQSQVSYSSNGSVNPTYTTSSTASGTATVTTTVTGTYSGITTGTAAIDTSGISFVDTSTGNSTTSKTITCSVANATDQTSGATIANYKSYICVIYTGTNVAWQGSIKFKGIYKYNYFLNCGLKYASKNVNTNQDHPSSYQTVTTSLDNQNYYVYTAATSAQTNNSTAACNTTTSVFSTWTNTSAFVQQDCRNITSNTSLDSNCP